VTRSLGGTAWCSACRQYNSQLAQFCRHCGARLRTTDLQSDVETTTASSQGPGPLPAPETTAPAAFLPQPPRRPQAAPSPASSTAPASPPLRPRRRGPRVGAPWHTTDADEPSGRSPWLRRAAIAAVAAIALLALAGWQAHWPAAVFGAKAKGAAVGASPSSRTGITAPSRAPASPASSAFPAAPSASATNSAGPASTPSASGPAGTVDAYFAAITARDYAKAWQLGGQNLGTSYEAFVSGFGGTAKDTVTILSVAGDVVTARLVAYQTDGTVKTYQGTYTVQNGEISQSNVQQVS
jgi:eukaryotic-like serine/threonine-protein kinase